MKVEILAEAGSCQVLQPQWSLTLRFMGNYERVCAGERHDLIYVLEMPLKLLCQEQVQGLERSENDNNKWWLSFIELEDN